MVIFNSYVKLPEGIYGVSDIWSERTACIPPATWTVWYSTASASCKDRSAWNRNITSHHPFCCWDFPWNHPSSSWGVRVPPFLETPIYNYIYIYILIYRLRKSDEQIVESLQLRLPSWWIKLFIFVWGECRGLANNPGFPWDWHT